jgi:kynurenine formamidase
MNRRPILFALCATTLLAHVALTHAQTADKGPWWPHALWGAGDQAGASNWITPEKIVASLKLVERGKVYELGQIYDHNMPLYGNRTYSLTIPGSPSGGPYGDDNWIYHDEFLCGEIGQVGTQFDGPGHIGLQLTMEDGQVEDVFYNGYTRTQMRAGGAGTYGLQKLGIEHIKPYLTRGILIDIAGFKGVEALDHAYEVTLADVRAALKRQGMSEKDIEDGDALFFRYGWSKYWTDAKKYNTDPPGIGLEVAKWVVQHNASMIGSDQWMTEVKKSATEIPVHIELIPKNGIWNLENMRFDDLIEDEVYEFLFVFTPIRFSGATGSPGRPIAIR